MDKEEDTATDEWKAHLAERKRLMDELGMPKDWDWADPDNFVLYGCMRALDLYVYESGGIEKLDRFTADLEEEYKDKEDPSGGVVKKQICTQSEAAAIWRYWHEERPALEKRITDESYYLYGTGPECAEKNEKRQIFKEEDIERYKKYHAEMYGLVDRKDDEILERLMKIRKGLWT